MNRLNMIYLDLALRGGAITLMLLLALLIWRTPINREGRLSVSALALSESAYLITTAALPLELKSHLHSNLLLLSSFTPAAVTLLIVTIFIDAPGRRWPWVIAALATSAAHYADTVLLNNVSLCLVMAIILFASLLILSHWSTRDDLVECRCRARCPYWALRVP